MVLPEVGKRKRPAGLFGGYTPDERFAGPQAAEKDEMQYNDSARFQRSNQ
jgi:hypothetical protein